MRIRRKKDPEAVRAEGRASYARHAEKRRQEARDRRAAGLVKLDPIKAGAKNDRRRARLAAAPGSYTPAEREAVFYWFGFSCCNCAETNNLTIDHIVPLACGGANSIENLQLLCLECNSAKRDKPEVPPRRSIGATIWVG